MPIATSLAEALGTEPLLQDVVAAVADIAETLSRLHNRQPPMAHRDVKPSNCYRYAGAWVISDFGLIDVPSGPALTVGAKALGPRNFIAPEMVLTPDTADGRRADVYSLGKTLWALATGNAVAPPGEHRLEWAWKRLDAWGVDHPRAFFLDRIIDQMTREPPAERITMALAAGTLRDWVKAAPQAATVADLKVDDLAKALGDVLARERQPIEVRGRQLETAQRIAEEMATRAEEVLRVLRESVLPNAAWDPNDVSFSIEVLSKVADQIPPTGRVAAYRTIKNMTSRGMLSTAVGVALSTDSQVALAAGHVLVVEGVRREWIESAVVLLDSQQQEREIARVVGALLDNFRPALAAFVQAVKVRSS